MMRRDVNIVSAALVIMLLAACSSPTAESYYLQGKQYRETDQPVEAVRAFVSATRVNSDEYGFKGRSYSNMATMCRIGEQHETAFALYARSREQFRRAGDSLAEAYALNNMAWEKAVLADKETALRLVDSAVFLCPDEAVQAKVSESRAAACLYAGEYDSTLHYARQAVSSSVYRDILCAQAHTFLGNNDSALFYARSVMAQTANPRYLDDACYILTHCDSTAGADEIRSLASQRSDTQRKLERNDPEWMEAMLLAQEALRAHPKAINGRTILHVILICILVLSGLLLLSVVRRRRKADSLQQQCRLLLKSPNLREELHWNDYALFAGECDARLSQIVSKLSQRGLSEREIRICVLVLIGFSYAEMAEILYRAENGIGKDKYMIAKHLGVSVKQLRETLLNIASGHA